MQYTLVIGADHRGYALKEFLKLKSSFGSCTAAWHDVGAYTPERTDYPLYVEPVVQALKEGRADYGILLCGSGIGIAIAANRFQGIYAGVVWNPEVAQMAKKHDNVNVLVLPADYLDDDQAVACITAWLESKFLEGRYLQRLTMIDQ